MARRARLWAVLIALVVLELAVYRFEPPGLAADPATQLRRVALGALLTLVLLLAVGSLLRRQLTPLPLTEDERDPALPGAIERSHHDARWFIHLRWLTAAVALGLITCARAEARPLLLSWWAALVAANLAFEGALRRWQRYEAQILAQAIADLLILAGFLNASGGLENPLYTVFVFHVIVGRILLRPRLAPIVTLAAMALFGFLALGEYAHLLPHYTNSFFPHPEAHAGEGSGHEGHATAEAQHAAYDLPFVLGRTVPLLAVLLLADFFMASVMQRLRSSEQSMRQSMRTAVLERERLERVVDAAGIGMMQVDTDLSVRWFSGKVASWFGWTDQALGLTCPLFVSPGGCEVCVVREAFDSGKPAATERHVVRGTHGERFYRHSASALRDVAGSVVQVVEVVEDITDRRALEAEAIRAGKLSVLGRMAAGIAHEIGNPLSSISTRLRLLERRSKEPVVAESVTILREQIARISRIVQGVSHFGRVRRRDRALFEVNELVEEMVRVIELDRRARSVRFVLEPVQPPARVFGVRDQIGQILLNLLLNAVEVSPPGATVSVRTSRKDDEVLLAVTDEGPGISGEARDFLFEPFFTTKAEGTGLGLSISLGFATAHGGRIEAESLSGGARFVLALPREEAPQQGSGRG